MMALFRVIQKEYWMKKKDSTEKYTSRKILILNETIIISRNGLLLCVQFVFTNLNNSLLFLVALRELSRELRVINYNLRKFSAWQTNHSGERGLAVVPWRLISSGVRMGEIRDLQCSPLVPCTSELLKWNSVKIYELALLIFEYKSSKPKKIPFLFKELTQCSWQRGVNLKPIALHLLKAWRRSNWNHS